MANSKKIDVICDDFGLDSKTNKAILELAVLKKISGTSVLITNAATYEADFNSLKEFKIENPNFRVGLHLNLTEGQSLSEKKTFKGLIPLAAQATLLPFFIKNMFEKEVSLQFSTFENLFGHPDHVDGHQHIQYLLPIFGLIKSELERRRLNFIPLRRYPFIPSSANFKRLVLNTLHVFGKKSDQKGYLIDLDDIMENKVNILELQEQYIEVMAHVAELGNPQKKLQDKSVDFGTFSFENRVKQFEFLKINSLLN